MSYLKIENRLRKNAYIKDGTLLDYIETRLNEEDLMDYVESISVDSTESSNYNPFTNTLYINSKEIFLENNENNCPDLSDLLCQIEKNMRRTKNCNYVNMYNLFSINHEINHIIQRKTRYEEDSLKSDLFMKGQTTLFIDDKYFKSFYYRRFHDKFYLEYNANIESYLELIYLLNSYNMPELKNSLTKINLIAAKKIIYSYEDIINMKKIASPIDNLNKLYDHLTKNLRKHGMYYKFLDILNEENIDFYDLPNKIEKEKPTSELEKLRLGFPLNKDTYNYIDNVSNKKIKTLNMFENIPR